MSLVALAGDLGASGPGDHVGFGGVAAGAEFAQVGDVARTRIYRLGIT